MLLPLVNVSLRIGWPTTFQIRLFFTDITSGQDKRTVNLHLERILDSAYIISILQYNNRILSLSSQDFFQSTIYSDITELRHRN